MNYSFKTSKNFKAGIGVAELLVYIGIMTLALVSIVTLLINSAKIMQSVQAEKEVRVSALSILERMSREIKVSEGIVLADSVFGDDNGRLSVLSTLDEDNPRVVTFAISDEGELEIFYNGEPMGALTTSAAGVEKMKFTRLMHGESESVRVELVLYPRKQPTKSTTFYSTAVLRGLY